MSAAESVWWGELEVPPSGRRLEIGPLELELARRDREWRLRHREDPAASEDRLSRSAKVSGDEDARWEGILRIGAETTGQLAIRAATADRSIVSLPVDPFVIPSRGSVLLFVSTPLWLVLMLDGESVYEVPTQRPRDCWVGPNVGPGQAAYANRTQCRQALDELPRRPHRVVTPVSVSNRAGESLLLERVVLAVPYLSLFATGTGRVWTERIDVEIDGGEIESSIRPGGPSEAGRAERISTPRDDPPSGGLGRMLASVF